MNIANYVIPDDLYFDHDHWWIRRQGRELVMGMDDFAQRLAGEIVFGQLPAVGKRLIRGEKLAKVESGKWLGKILTPGDGELTAVNQELGNNPTLINQDCYGASWMYRIGSEDISQLEGLIHGAEAIEKWMQEEIAKHTQG